MSRDVLVAALSRALSAVDVRARVRSALSTGSPPRRVVAIGKAASAMIDGALDACADSIEAALVVLPDDSPPPRDDARIRLLRAAHPLPDERSVAAGEATLAFGADLALISGGTSSLVFVPIDTLDRARAAIRALLVSGADVRAINTVRRHASLAHGGRLGPIDTLLASDVIDGSPSDVGSGPTIEDETTASTAHEILSKYTPAHADLLLRESPKGARSGVSGQRVEVLVTPESLAEAVAYELVRAGLRASVADRMTGDVFACARLCDAIARKRLRDGEAIVWPAEPSLRIDVPSPGAGGRCTHLAALVARALPPGVTFVAAASDGVDGSSGTSGAVVTRESFPDRAALDAAIAAFDTGPLHLVAGTALPLAPTGVNLADLHVLAKF